MAIWVPDLSGRRGPKYLQIVEAMADDIAAGRLAIGTRLPPHRELAYQLDLSPNTTSRAYAEGVKRALLRGEVGRGTYVRAAEPQFISGPVANLHRPSHGPIDLSRNLPTAGLAEAHLPRVLEEIASSTGLAALLDDQTDAKPSHHIKAATRWLTLCGVAAEPDEIVITNGAQHGLLCTLMGLFRPGDLLLTEALTYAPVSAMADRLGINTAAVASDSEGLCPDSLDELCRRAAPKALYLIPTVQVPTTATLSQDRRAAIAAIAKRHDVLIIEDDVFGLLKPNRPAPLSTLAPDHVIYTTSVSKCVAPGLRVGFLRSPRKLVPALRQAVSVSTWMTPPITAEIAARLILDGTAEQLIDGHREIAARRQRLARSVLHQHQYAADPNGLHLWLPLPEGWKSEAFRIAAERRGVLISEARSFAADPAMSSDTIRLCLSHELDETRVQRGLTEIKELLESPPVQFDVIV